MDTCGSTMIGRQVVITILVPRSEIQQIRYISRVFPCNYLDQSLIEVLTLPLVPKGSHLRPCVYGPGLDAWLWVQGQTMGRTALFTEGFPDVSIPFPRACRFQVVFLTGRMTLTIQVPSKCSITYAQPFCLFIYIVCSLCWSRAFILFYTRYIHVLSLDCLHHS